MLVNKLLLLLSPLSILTRTAVQKEIQKAGFCQLPCSLQRRRQKGAALHFYPTDLEVTCKCKKKYINHTPLSQENSRISTLGKTSCPKWLGVGSLCGPKGALVALISDKHCILATGSTWTKKREGHFIVPLYHFLNVTHFKVIKKIQCQITKWRRCFKDEMVA